MTPRQLPPFLRMSPFLPISPSNPIISLTLWHGLHHSLPRHPLLWYVSLKDKLRQHNPYVPQVPFKAGVLHSWTPVLGAVIALQLGLIFWRPEVLLLPIGLIAGLMAAVGICGRISQEREQGRYELMGLTPSGRLGASWALGTRYFRRDLTWEGLRQLVDRFHMIWLFILFPIWLLAGLFLTTQSSAFREINADLYAYLMLPLNGTILLLISRADFQYATLTGAIIGMIAPSYAPRRLDSAMLAMGSFLLLRFTFYALSLFIGTLLMPFLAFTFAGDYGGVLTSVAWLALYIVLQELSVYVVCGAMAWRLNTTIKEICQIYRQSI